MTSLYKQLQTKSNCSMEENVYLNACECAYFGFGYTHMNKLGISEEVAKKIWTKALKDLGNNE